MILGLDISSSITGATIINKDGEVILCEHWDTRNKNKFEDIMDKCEFIRSQFFRISHKYTIEEIYVEQSLQTFRSGFSSAQTLSTLAKMNGVVSWVCFKSFGIKPQYLSASTARKQVGLKIPRGENAKSKVLEFVVDNDNQFNVEYTKHGNPKPGYFDRADSWIIAKAGYQSWKEKR